MLTRREFIKISGLILGASAIPPHALETVKRLDIALNFDATKSYGVAIPLTSKPTKEIVDAVVPVLMENMHGTLPKGVPYEIRFKSNTDFGRCAAIAWLYTPSIPKETYIPSEPELNSQGYYLIKRGIVGQ